MDEILSAPRPRATRRQFIGAATAFASAGLSGAGWANSRSGDLLLRGGRIIDGTGRPGFTGDVKVSQGRIARIDLAGRADLSGAIVIDATGLVIAPGFIDMHAHVSHIDGHPKAENFIRQGVTTILNSLHSEDLPWPLDTYMRDLRVAPNVAYVAGHNWARKRVLGLADRAPSATELAAMEALVDEAMRDGAFGLGTGLEYIPSAYSQTEEVIALARVAARRGGLYVTHLRDEGPRSIEAVKEAISIGRAAGMPVHINHHKLAGRAQWGWSRRTLALIEEARSSGHDVTLDLYPYDAFSTVSDILFPAWALAGGPEAFAAKVRNATTRARLIDEMNVIFPQQTGEGPESVQFRDLAPYPAFKGSTLKALAQSLGRPLTPNGLSELLIELQLKGGFVGIFHAMAEEDIERIMTSPWSMFCTDGDLVELGTGFPHPRSYGAFPRVLARYVREKRVLTLEQAIHKMTAMPAARLGLADRGRVLEGLIADLVVFDPVAISDRATYTDPHHFAEGVRHLIVAGELVVRDSALTGALPGRALRRPLAS